MYDKQVRRRRAVLFALVVCCLVLLTAYFGESSGGPLKSVQTGAMEVLRSAEQADDRSLAPLQRQLVRHTPAAASGRMEVKLELGTEGRPLAKHQLVLKVRCFHVCHRMVVLKL